MVSVTLNLNSVVKHYSPIRALAMNSLNMHVFLLHLEQSSSQFQPKCCPWPKFKVHVWFL